MSSPALAAEAGRRRNAACCFLVPFALAPNDPDEPLHSLVQYLSAPTDDGPVALGVDGGCPMPTSAALGPCAARAVASNHGNFSCAAALYGAAALTDPLPTGSGRVSGTLWPWLTQQRWTCSCSSASVWCSRSPEATVLAMSAFSGIKCLSGGDPATNLPGSCLRFPSTSARMLLPLLCWLHCALPSLPLWLRGRRPALARGRFLSSLARTLCSRPGLACV